MRKMFTIVSLINQLRREYQLNNINYNTTTHNELQQLKTLINDDSFWYKLGNKSTSFNINNTTRTNRLEGSFIYPNYMFRDTYNTNLIRIFKYRIGQKKCFDFDTCPHEFCLKRQAVLTDKKPCSYAFAYLPKLLDPKLKSLSILTLKTQGIYVPHNLRKKQKNSFFVYAGY